MYVPEFNPNVALEWGRMRAMGKDVLLLVEQSFNRHRADSVGFQERRFKWNDPGPGIDSAVSNWLP
jgi:hypothetical protein